MRKYLSYVKIQKWTTPAISAFDIPGVLIFNPLTYAIIEALSWRWSYIIYGIATLAVGLPTGLTFKPVSNISDNELKSAIKNSEEDHELLIDTPSEKSYDSVKQENNTICSPPENLTSVDEIKCPRKNKVILGVIWFLASVLKTFGYYTPGMILVSNHIYTTDLQ